jgi:hypothetical protein
MAKNNDRFRANMAKRIAMAKQKQELFYKKLALEVMTRVVMKSPVDTGRFRANWNVGYGTPNLRTDTITDASGGHTIAANTAGIMGLQIDGKTIWITNSLPYAYRLEYEGWSRQAPGGMVRVTLAELSGLVSGIARELRFT